MPNGKERLRLPVRLHAVLVGAVTALSCSSNTSSPTLPAFDGGPCTIKVPAGEACVTTCYEVDVMPVEPYACQIACAKPEAGQAAGACSNELCSFEETDAGLRALC
jgi:hypothetical protein